MAPPAAATVDSSGASRTESLGGQVGTAAPTEQMTSAPAPAPAGSVSGVVTNALGWAGLSPFASGSPVAPGESPATLALMAGWRRLSQQGLVSEKPTMVSDPAQNSLTIDSIGADQRTLAAAAANTAPVDPDPTVGAPDHTTGVVTGNVNATDPDGDPLSYAVSTPPAGGTALVNSTGNFTYTPTQATRLRAGLTPGADVDSFTVAVSDGKASTPMNGSRSSGC